MRLLTLSWALVLAGALILVLVDSRPTSKPVRHRPQPQGTGITMLA
ncbi:MAG: hypothetical protein J2P50_15490 [Hyphomicrobiaceae bacterium]|nr:hypothetical protein [Hyphomicrobiaceae bacterium]